jgi:transcriptional regulator with XRE-family HTH domain
MMNKYEQSLETLGQRIAWARNQQGLTLDEVSRRSGLAIGYISQLENNSKDNPTLTSLVALAKALCVTVAFLLGEVKQPGPGAMEGGEVAQAFAAYVKSLPTHRQESIRKMSVEERFMLVIDFLCNNFPGRFTRPIIAFQIGISVRALNDVLERNCQVSPFALRNFCHLTGIGLQYFAAGNIAEIQPELRMEQMMRYAGVIKLAEHAKMGPERLERLIREAMAGN